MSHSVRTIRGPREAVPAAVGTSPEPSHGSAPPVRKRSGRRVLVAAPQPFYEDRGTPIAVQQLLQALVHLGYQVDLVTYPIGQTIGIEGVRYFRCSNPLRINSVPIGFSARKLALDTTLVLAMRNCLRHNRYDFIHGVEEAAFAAVKLGHHHRIRVIYDMQSSIPEQLANRALFRMWPIPLGLAAAERWLLRRADAVIGSAGLAERIRRIAPQTLTREWRYASPVAWTPLDEVTAARREMDLTEGSLAVIYCGNFAPYQGVTELLSAMPLVRKELPQARLVLIGVEASDAQAMREEIAARQLDGAVVMLPRQSRARIGRYLAAADVLVSPRLYGGNLPLKIFDYLAAGRPIVATDIPTHRAVLTDEMALLVPPRAAAMSAGIVRALRDREHAESIARHGREYAERNLGWMGFVESVDELYTSVANA